VLSKSCLETTSGFQSKTKFLKRPVNSGSYFHATYPKARSKRENEREKERESERESKWSFAGELLDKRHLDIVRQVGCVISEVYVVCPITFEL
jgi:hypothetical protein